MKEESLDWQGLFDQVDDFEIVRMRKTSQPKKQIGTLYIVAVSTDQFKRSFGIRKGDRVIVDRGRTPRLGDLFIGTRSGLCRCSEKIANTEGSLGTVIRFERDFYE